MVNISTPRFQMRFDPSAQRIVAEAIGFWTLDDAQQFFAALKANIEEAIRRCGDFTIFGDFSGAAIQSAEVNDFNMNSHKILGSRARKVAILTSSSLKAMQLKRFLNDARFGFFADRSEALAWLDS